MKRQTFSKLILSYISIWGIGMAYFLWILHCSAEIDVEGYFKMSKNFWYLTLVFIISFMMICTIGSSTIEE
jgi:hypothetical protein